MIKWNPGIYEPFTLMKCHSNMKLLDEMEFFYYLVYNLNDIKGKIFFKVRSFSFHFVTLFLLYFSFHGMMCIDLALMAGYDDV